MSKPQDELDNLIQAIIDWLKHFFKHKKPKKIKTVDFRLV